MCYTAPNSTFPCGGCPAGFSRCAGRCWHWLDVRVDYPAAAQYCANLGAHLAALRTEEENLCPSIVSGGSFNPYWLGYQSSDGVFVGDDGCGPANYTKWGLNEPELDGDKTCVAYRRYDGKWFRDLCNNTWPAICQMPHCYQPQCQ